MLFITLLTSSKSKYLILPFLADPGRVFELLLRARSMCVSTDLKLRVIQKITRKIYLLAKDPLSEILADVLPPGTLPPIPFPRVGGVLVDL